MSQEEKTYTVICPKCQKTAPWVENKAKYGSNRGKSYMCYWCKECDTYVGCHNNTREPLGTMADSGLRKLRMACHVAFDRRWKETEGLSRSSAYKMLWAYMGFECHIGATDTEMCRKILDLCNFTINWKYRFALKIRKGGKRNKKVKAWVLVINNTNREAMRYKQRFSSVEEAEKAMASFYRRMTLDWTPNIDYWECLEDQPQKKSA
jgi:hypothetical protein